MWPFDRMRVGLKLGLLGAISVAGALLLSALLARDAQERANTAAALGSLEDLVRLSERMTLVVHGLQQERARTAYDKGTARVASSELLAARANTDRALAALAEFLDERNTEELPPKLKQELGAARARLAELPAVRARLDAGSFEIEPYIERVGRTNSTLIAATAALAELSDDGQLTASISRLVALMEVIERGSREHALLSFVFAKREFPPGTYRYFLTLLTEHAVYADSFRKTADAEESRAFEDALQSPDSKRANAMRVHAQTAEAETEVLPEAWLGAQQSSLSALQRLEEHVASDIRGVAGAKVAEAESALWFGAGSSALVVLLTSVLGWAISRGIRRSVLRLVEATAAVEKHGDYSIRVEQLGNDELGRLGESFNAMLSALQDRDRELEAHRANLQALVEERTSELSTRNEELRLVLDNVEQGLMMIGRDGNPLGECSVAMTRWFGDLVAGESFAALIARHDEALRARLELAYEQLTSDVFPIEVALDQFPKHFERNGRHYALAFIPIVHEAVITSVLLVIDDETRELTARRAEAAQRQQIRTFERVMRDRPGFLEFFNESRALIERIRDASFADPADRMRAIHTLKGNAAIFDVSSVATAAHQLEQALIDGESDDQAVLEQLLGAWDEFAHEIVPLLAGDVAHRVEVTLADLERVIARVRAHAPRAELERSLRSLEHEPARLRMQRLEQQLVGLARRLGKPEPQVLIDVDDTRLPAATFRPLWTTMTHVIRNLVDHGLEPAEARLANGKPERNQVTLKVRSDAASVSITVSDDGRGIQWEEIRDRARAAGLAHDTRSQLLEAVLSPGISTMASASHTSGRGIGMAAVRAACAELGGTLALESEPGAGTTLRFEFPSPAYGVPVVCERPSMTPLSLRPGRPSAIPAC